MPIDIKEETNSIARIIKEIVINLSSKKKEALKSKIKDCIGEILEDVNNLPPVELIRPIGKYESCVSDYQSIKCYLNDKLLGDFCVSLLTKSQFINLNINQVRLSISILINNKINPYVKRIKVLLVNIPKLMSSAKSESESYFLKQYKSNLIRLNEAINTVIDFASGIKEALKT